MGFVYKRDQSKLSSKILIRSMVILGHGKDNKFLHIAILDSKMQYIEYDIEIRHDYLTPFVGVRLRSLFLPYYLSHESEVIFENTFNLQHPFYLYMSFIKQHVDFNLRTTTADKMLGRVAAYYNIPLVKDWANTTPCNINKIWRRLLKNGKCPWVNKEYDQLLQNKSLKTMFQCKVLRICAFYVLIKDAMMTINRRCIAKRESKQQDLDV